MTPNVMESLRIKCCLCVQQLKWIPVIFIATIIAWSYYAYVIQLCCLTVESIYETVCYIILYHALFIMFVWSYWQTIFTSIGEIPIQFKLQPNEVEILERSQSPDVSHQLLESFATNLPVYCRGMNGSIRYCEKCRCVKPDRAHHCSVCGTCVLKMDHHCPWVNNCVSFRNYKFFVLFLGYGLFYCFFIAVTSTQYFVKFWTHDLEGSGRYHILFLFFVSVMFGISLCSLFAYHCYLVSVNRSTLESFRSPAFKNGPNKHGFNLGTHANFIEVFGEDKSKWFLPFYSTIGNGVSFHQRAVDEESFVH